VGIHHGRAHVSVAEEFLHLADVMSLPEKMCGEGVTQGMGAGLPADAGGKHGGMQCALEGGFVDMVPAEAPRRIPDPVGCGEEVGPPPGAGDAGEFLFKGIGDVCGAAPGVPVGVVGLPCSGDLSGKRFAYGPGQGQTAVSSTFGVPDHEGTGGGIQVLDAEAETFEEAESAAVEEHAHELVGRLQAANDVLDFSGIQDGGESGRPCDAQVGADGSERGVEDVVVEEDEGIEGLVLGGSGDVSGGGEHREEAADMGFVQVCGVVECMEADVLEDPGAVGLPGTGGEVFQGDGLVHEVHEAGCRGRGCHCWGALLL
jgi:hypothetical protein